MLTGADLTKSLLGSQEETGLVSFTGFGETGRLPCGANGPNDDRRLLLNGILTTPGHTQGLTVTPTSYQKPQRSRKCNKSWTLIVIKQEIHTRRA